MAIGTYSLKSAGRAFKLSENFALDEFACKDGSDLVPVSEELVTLLEKIRTWARATISPDAIVIITSGYRTASYNASPAVKGERHSKHVLGQAADIKIAYGRNRDRKYERFVGPKVIHAALEDGSITGSRFIGGLGLYSTWLHVDVRSTIARWKGK